MGLFDFFKRKSNQKKMARSFSGALPSRFTSWLNTSFEKINGDINRDLVVLIARARELQKNNTIVQSYLNMCEENIIGRGGFTLQSQIKGPDGKLDQALNDEIEWNFYEWGKPSDGNLTLDGCLGDKDLDKLILKCLLIDGEAFIRIHKSNAYPFGVKFEVLDALSIDFTKIREAGAGTNAIILGVEVDADYRPVAYWRKTGNSTTFQAGKEERIPANEVIHLFKRIAPQQVRGYSPLNACMDDLKQLADYQKAELLAAKVAACMAIAYERNGQAQQGDFLDEGTDDEHDFVQSLEPGMSVVAPTGYSIKTLQSNHPCNSFDSFNAAILKKVASSLGVCYNKLCKDMTSVNFSSLRYAAVDEQVFFEDWQTFLVEHWKEVQYKLFLENLILNTDILKPSQMKDAMRYHTFICQKSAYFDPGKDVLAKKYQMELGILNPLQALEAQGMDPQEVLRGWRVWKDLCGEYGLSFEDAKLDGKVLDTQETASDEDEMNTARD